MSEAEQIPFIGPVFQTTGICKHTYKFLHLVPEIRHLELLKTADNNKKPKQPDLKIKKSNGNRS